MARTYNTSKLRGRIAEIFETQLAFSEALNCRKELISLTLSGKRELTQSEIEDWAEALQIDPSDYQIYF